jgi:nitroreductase
MDVMEAIRTRRSVRNFQHRDIEEEKLRKVLEAGQLAPSARNLQERKFIVVKDASVRKRLAEAAKGQMFVAEAPVVIVACGTVCDYIMACGQLAYPINVAIAVDHMTLAAVEEGLGTCWLGAFYEDQVKEILRIPREVRVVAMLVVGYPAGQVPESRGRKPLDEVVVFERWK